jgi:two-component system, cell cycle response regulator
VTARVLVVDDILANVKLLDARLSAEYFEVLTAYSGREALDVLERERVDVVLLDVMMPGMDGFEVCRRIKSTPRLAHVPVIMVTALDQPSDKVQGLGVGADDFLTKPVDDIALITRVKNLVRLKVLADELITRASTSKDMGLVEPEGTEWPLEGQQSKILLVEDHAQSAQRLTNSFADLHAVTVETDAQVALLMLAEQNFDLLVVSLSLATADGLRLCSQVRSLERTRHMPIIILVEPGDNARLLRGLDMGVNDYVMRPIDRNELHARVNTQIKRKRHTDLLRAKLDESVEHAVTDSLTGLHNRRYMEGHLATLVSGAIQTGRALSLIVADIDFFKAVNDSYGHAAGDRVLREFANRFRRNTRGIDLTCRYGGEEFVVVMPDTDVDRAAQVAERLRSCVEAEPFAINSTAQIRITASVGIATLERRDDTAEKLFGRADQALYTAKRKGRNRVVGHAA